MVKDRRARAQFSLPGFEPPPEPDNFFFAVQPDSQTADRAVQLSRGLRADYQLQGKLLNATVLHVSLFGYGSDVSLDLLKRGSEAASTLAVPPFTVGFDRVLSFAGKSRFGSRHPVVLAGSDGVEGFKMLRRALAAAIERHGLRIKTSEYTPHMTLAYDERVVAELIIDPIIWTVSNFALIRSHVGQGRHTVLARWSLPNVRED